MKILVAAPDKNDSRKLEENLCALGHNCVVTNEEQQVLRLFEEHSPELVFMDINFPNQKTLKFIQTIRQVSFDIFDWKPILVLMNDMNEDRLLGVIEAGADDFILKPFSRNIILAKLKSFERLNVMRQSLIEYGQQLRVVNDKLLDSTQLLSDLSLKDPLTMIGNRRAFQDNIDKIIKGAIRNTEPLSMIMFDIDLFKFYNDHFGHQRGDRCLKEVAELFSKQLLRPQDFLARIGGEEFAITLANTDINGAIQVAERLRKTLEEHNIVHPFGMNKRVTASFGVAFCHPHTGFRPEDLLHAADLALYDAKKQGRNCVVSCGVPVESLVSSSELPLQKLG